MGEWVTWEARHFGITQKLTSKITEFECPNYFVDEMVRDAFKSFKHEHIFKESYDNKFDIHYTIMTDIFHFQSPFGVLGKLANIIFLKRYMTNLLATRNALLRQKAEELSEIK